MKSGILGAGLLALTLTSCGWLSNEVFYEGYGHVSGRLLLGDQPASGALVFVQNEEGVWDRGKSDEQGRFYIAARAGRSQKLVALWGDATGLQRSFHLPMDVDQDLGDLQMLAFGQLAGQVSLEGMSPTEAEIFVEGTDWTIRPTETGSFLLNLPPGTWNLHIRAEAHLTERVTSVKVLAGQLVQLEAIALKANQDYTCQESRPVTDRYFQLGTGALDLLFVIDNSRSMVGEQVAMAQAMSGMVSQLQRGEVDYRIAVITTGVESEGCAPCPPDNPYYYSCINETGESGRFQSRIGQYSGEPDNEEFSFLTDDSCRIVAEDNLSCFYDSESSSGTSLVGVNGCGYERGLAAMKNALSEPLLSTWNADFLRAHARLSVVMLSDEDDCGAVGDINENLPVIAGWACYYAAKGVAPDGSTVDPEGKEYSLTPVEDYAEFLRSLKDSPAQVSFSAIVGLSDPSHPGDTIIEYEGTDLGAAAKTACENTECIEQCTDGPDSPCVKYCKSFPGTRYVALAKKLGGRVESICQSEFYAPLSHIVGQNTGFRYTFELQTAPLDPQLIAVKVAGQLVADWQYHAPGNEIVFEPGAAPEQFETIDIEYTAACP